jgi:hypothetical protein
MAVVDEADEVVRIVTEATERRSARRPGQR